MLTNTKKTSIHSADGKQFNFSSIKNLFIIANNSKTTKDEVKYFLKKLLGRKCKR